MGEKQVHHKQDHGCPDVFSVLRELPIVALGSTDSVKEGQKSKLLER